MIEIRSAENDQELNRVFYVLDRAFRRTKADYFIRRTTIGKKDYDFWQTRVLVFDGEIVSTIEIFPTLMWFEGKKIKNAGIGSVATDPDFQGKGFGIKIVEDTNRFAREKDFHVATLFTSIFDFYAKSDYFKVTYPFYEVGKIFNVPEDREVVTFRPYLLTDIVKIHEQYNRELIGPVVKDERDFILSFAYLSEDTYLFLVSLREGVPTGFIRAREFKNTIEVLEFASLEPDADLAIFIDEIRKRAFYQRVFINLSDHEREKIKSVELKPRGHYSMMFALLDESMGPREEFIEKFSRKGNFWLADLY